MNWFKKLFNIKPNDWQVIWTQHAVWKRSKDDIPYASCYYEIYYSLSRNEFKLITGGHMPKHHGYYKEAIKLFNKYITTPTLPK